MKRIFVVALTVAATLAVAASAVVATFSVLPERTGDGYLLLWPSAAKECRDGGGCVVLSSRQGNELVMSVYAAGRRSTEKGL
jgi:hypothetical protein